MRTPALFLLPILAISAACGGSGANSEKVAPVSDNSQYGQHWIMPDDNEIMGKAYDSGYSVPDGFLVDERAETTGSYTVHHVLDESGSFEVCSDDLVDAQALEDADNSARAVNGYYVASYENDRYFEFIRELTYTESIGNISELTTPGFARVFKCGHTNRNGVDRAIIDGYSGRLDAARLNSETLREFSEYLWQFTFFNVSQKKVIGSVATMEAAGPGHMLLLAFVINQGANSCDRIDVIEWRFSANATSGDIFGQFDTVRSFEATHSDGISTLCD